MSIESLLWAFRTDAGDSSAKVVLLAVANFADEDGRCWPSQKRIATMSNLSDRRVRDALARLEEKGLITRAPRFREDGGRAADMITLVSGRGGRGRGDAPATTPGTPSQPPPGDETAGLASLEPTKGESPTEPKNAREFAKAIFEESPPIARKRSSATQVLEAVEAAKNRGKNLQVVRRAVAAYYADPDTCREEHRFAKGVHRVVQHDFWETWAQAEGVEHIDTTTRLQVDRQMFENWALEPQEWSPERRGPAPDQPNCRLSTQVMEEYGHVPGTPITPEVRMAAARARSRRYAG